MICVSAKKGGGVYACLRYTYAHALDKSLRWSSVKGWDVVSFGFRASPASPAPRDSIDVSGADMGPSKNQGTTCKRHVHHHQHMLKIREFEHLIAPPPSQLTTPWVPP